MFPIFWKKLEKNIKNTYFKKTKIELVFKKENILLYIVYKRSEERKKKQHTGRNRPDRKKIFLW